MTTTLFHGEPNGPSFAALVALFEKAVPANLVHIDLAAGERHAQRYARQPEVAMSVEGEGPVLVVDGEAMADSLFIACYLDDVGPGPALRPADPYGRWELMAWCRQLTERIAPAAAYLGCWAHAPHANANMLAGIESLDLRARWDEITARRFANDRLADSRQKVTQTVEKTENLLDGRQWLMGDFSIADFESYAWLAGMTELVPTAFAGKPRTGAWLDRVRTRPSAVKALSLAKQPNPETCWAPGPEINRWG